MPTLLSHTMTKTPWLGGLTARAAASSVNKKTSVDKKTLEDSVDFETQLNICLADVERECTPQLAPNSPYTFFFSVTDGQKRAHVIHVTASSFASTWSLGVSKLQAWLANSPLRQPWLRVDWVEGARAVSWERLLEQLALTQRNYFRLGLALDSKFQVAFTEQETNANAMLYAAGSAAHAALNRHNFETYARLRFGANTQLELPPAGSVYLLSMRGVFCQDDGVAHPLIGSGLEAGRRTVALNPDSLVTLLRKGSEFMAQRVKPTGLFVYGCFTCFDRTILTYNTLRHAGTLYAMLQAYELTRDAILLEAIESALQHLTGMLIRRQTLPDGQAVAFLLDGAEIKLGGSAMCLLVLIKYCEVTNTRHWMSLLDELADGVAWMQDPESGQFRHVLDASTLAPREQVRVIYYDGEAVFGMLRLYALTGNARWIAVAEKAIDHFIAQKHWRSSEHWLGHCANEMTRWRPLKKYFRFGIHNVADHFDYVLERKTTLPTLLELMTTTQEMLERLSTLPALQHLLVELDKDKFDKPLKHRAQYLLNGFLWSKYAMYFRRPIRILGAFFIQAFRVRFDDVEHCLSGLIGYRRLLVARAQASALDTPFVSLP